MLRPNAAGGYLRACLCAAALAGLGTIGCGDATRPELRASSTRLGVWVPGPLATILQTSNSELRDQTFVVVEDAQAWRDTWTRTWPAVAPPDVDFVLSSVIVVAMGRRNAPGYTVTIDSVVTRTNGATLHATETRMDASCGNVDPGRTPVHMVLVPDHPPVNEWLVRTTARTCGP